MQRVYLYRDLGAFVKCASLSGQRFSTLRCPRRVLLATACSQAVYSRIGIETFGWRAVRDAPFRDRPQLSITTACESEQSSKSGSPSASPFQIETPHHDLSCWLTLFVRRDTLFCAPTRTSSFSNVCRIAAVIVHSYRPAPSHVPTLRRVRPPHHSEGSRCSICGSAGSPSSSRR
jgi:hypothetical protein